MNSDLRKNGSGYNDPTAYEAIKNNQSEIRFYKLLHTIFHICEIAGFQLEGRIMLKDKRTGIIYK